MSSHLYAACQAIDLRVADLEFRSQLYGIVSEAVTTHLSSLLAQSDVNALVEAAVVIIFRRLDVSGSMDAQARFDDAIGAATGIFVDALAESPSNPIPIVNAWRKDCTSKVVGAQEAVLTKLYNGQLDVVSRLGRTAHLYQFVRSTLGIHARKGDVASGGPQRTIGRSVSMIVEGLRSAAGRGAILAALGQSS